MEEALAIDEQGKVENILVVFDTMSTSNIISNASEPLNYKITDQREVKFSGCNATECQQLITRKLKLKVIDELYELEAYKMPFPLPASICGLGRYLPQTQQQLGCNKIHTMTRLLVGVQEPTLFPEKINRLPKNWNTKHPFIQPFVSKLNQNQILYYGETGNKAHQVTFQDELMLKNFFSHWQQ